MLHESLLPAPAALVTEHQDLHDQLMALVEIDGPLGEAAAEVAALLAPHTMREQSLAMPLLGLLPALAAGRIGSELAPAAALARDLREALPRMLQEHIAIVGAARHLFEMAEEVDRPDAAQVANQLIRHAEIEEDVIYPAAIVAGEYLAFRLRQEFQS